MNNSKIIKKDLDLEDAVEDIVEDLSEQEKIEAPKKKKVLNENQRKAVAINLAKGRENLKKKQEQQRIDREQRQKELETSIRKANQIKQKHISKMEKTKTKVNKTFSVKKSGVTFKSLSRDLSIEYCKNCQQLSILYKYQIEKD
jgi:rubrerythrin